MTNLSLLQSLQSLVHSSPSFLHVPSLLPFLNHYNIDVDSVTSEAVLAINFLNEASPLSSIHDVYAHLHGAQEYFSDILTVFQITMTIDITIASAERSFSSLGDENHTSCQESPISFTYRKRFVFQALVLTR